MANRVLLSLARSAVTSSAFCSFFPFPLQHPGRLSHHLFGLVEVDCTLRPAGSPSPANDLLHQRFRLFRRFYDCSNCCRLERELPGGFIFHRKSRLRTAHVFPCQSIFLKCCNDTTKRCQRLGTRLPANKAEGGPKCDVPFRGFPA